MSRLSPQQLDGILALQLTVAWAGESAGEPPRLGWWRSDLVDPEGGGDLFARLAPKTAAWASLGLVREAARRVDQSLRQKVATGDRIWTLFHFGFAVDEQLVDRIFYHRQHLTPPESLGERFLVGKPFSSDVLDSMLGSLGTPRVEVTPIGRKVDARVSSPAEAAVLLAAALRPLSASYPLPYIEVAG